MAKFRGTIIYSKIPFPPQRDIHFHFVSIPTIKNFNIGPIIIVAGYGFKIGRLGFLFGFILLVEVFCFLAQTPDGFTGWSNMLMPQGNTAEAKII